MYIGIRSLFFVFIFVLSGCKQNFSSAYSHLYRVTNTKCRIGTVFSPDDGHIVARNM